MEAWGHNPLVRLLPAPKVASPLGHWGRTPVKNPDAGRHELPAVPGPSFFFLHRPCATGGKSRDHRRQKILQSLPSPGPKLLHHDKSAQVAQLNAAVYNPPSVLTLKAHDENPAYKLLA